MDLLDSITVLRSSFLMAAVLILFANFVPTLSSRFLAYGARDSGQSRSKQSNHVGPDIINTLAGIRVPHSWFASFYIVSMLCSVLWATQISFGGSIFRAIAEAAQGRESTMTLDQVVVAWLLMFSQGMRRLYECLSDSKPSSARMWVGHWFFGLYYYIGINIAIWIEGSSTLLNEPYDMKHFSFRPPSIRSFVGILIFLLASGIQHDCHAYLASLKKYTVPEHPVFHRLVNPHYLAECFIYLALAVVAAPPGYVINRTIFCALILVSVNLGVTANGTKRWYEQKFGAESVKDRWRMIPFVY